MERSSASARAGIFEIFKAFLRLGLTSFGGPVAHLGYFRAAFVERRRWLDEAMFAEFVALCTVLPGPTSSQVGMLIGALRAGPAGALAAWLGFTLPSAILMSAFALTFETFNRAAGTFFAGFLAAAVAIVAQSVVQLARKLCPGPKTRAVALAAFVSALGLNHVAPQLQWLVIAGGALLGLALFRGEQTPGGTALNLHIAPRNAVLAGVLFAAAALGCAAGARMSPAGELIATLFRGGALVFGGGHVILPLLSTLVPNLIDARTFYEGYGAAQIMPGPLFSFAAFAGAAARTDLRGVAGAALGIIAIYAPSFLLLGTVIPVWNKARGLAPAAAALRGINASVVGLLAAVLVPLASTLATQRFEWAVAFLALVLLAAARLSPALVVAICGATGWVIARITTG